MDLNKLFKADYWWLIKSKTNNTNEKHKHNTLCFCRNCGGHPTQRLVWMLRMEQPILVWSWTSVPCLDWMRKRNLRSMWYNGADLLWPIKWTRSRGWMQGHLANLRVERHWMDRWGLLWSTLDSMRKQELHESWHSWNSMLRCISRCHHQHYHAKNR